MRVFLSWSGERSKAVAAALKDWLPVCIQSLEPWMSAADIDKGARWIEEVEAALESAQGQGIFCLTPENTTSPWLNFEAGVVASRGGKSCVYALLIGLEPVELKPPISLFQVTTTTKDDIFKLLKVLNIQCAKPLQDRVLERTFEANWGELEAAIATSVALIPRPPSHAASVPEGVAELVAITRRMERAIEEQSSSMRELLAFGLGSQSSAGSNTEDVRALRKHLLEHGFLRRRKEIIGDPLSLAEWILTLPPRSQAELSATLSNSLPKTLNLGAAFLTSKGIEQPDKLSKGQTALGEN
jgi:hypothetical protein